MNLSLTAEETTLLLTELDGIIENDRYFLSGRIQMLREIRAKIKPYPVRAPLPPARVYEPPSKGRYRRRGR
jgi:hypothetical protein